MKNVSTLTISFSIIVFALLSLTIDIAHPDSVSTLRPTDDISRSKAAFAVVNEAIARGLNLHTLSESDSWKLRGPVLLDIQADIHFQLREQFDRIVNTVDFQASLNIGSPSQNSPVRQDNTPVLYEKAAEIIRDFIAQKHISVIIMSDALIGMGEIAAIRGLRGEVPYTYEIINGASVSVPLQNIAALIKRPFITEIWPNSKGSFKLSDSVPIIGADVVHNAPPNGLGVTGQGVTVAVVDNGIYNDHPEFKGRIKDSREWVFDGPGEVEEHGNHVAGIIGAADDGVGVTGVAPEVSFLDASAWVTHPWVTFSEKCLYERSYCEAMSAIGWAARKRVINTGQTEIITIANTKADIINLSVGFDLWRYGREGDDPMSKLIDEVIEDYDIVVVVSAGNEAHGRASGPLPADKDHVDYNFHVESTGAFHVVLLQDAGDPDLDLEIYPIENDGTLGKLFCAEYSGLNLLNTSTERGSSYYGISKDYTKVKCNNRGRVYRYTVRVKRGDKNTPKVAQDYELWMTVGDDFKPNFYNSEDTIAVPGYSKKAITVGAIHNNYKIWTHSSRGPNTSNQPLKPEVVAPGVDIESTVLQKKNGSWYDLETGTSMAAPHVAGVAALILEAVGKNNNGKWNFSPAEVKSAIVRGAEDITNQLPDNTFGAGLVKADNIIFGATVDPGQKLLFRITPRLTEFSFPSGTLNAEKDLAVAISWNGNYLAPVPGTTLGLSAANVSNLSWQLLDQSGRAPVQVESQGSNYVQLQEWNYKKIISTGVASSGDYFYLNIIHNGTLNSISFTGASTHPIKKVNAKLDVNGDGVVDVKDLVEVAAVLKAAKKLTVSINDSPSEVDKDVNKDKYIDLRDIKAIVNELADAASAPTAPEADAASAPSAHQVEIGAIQQWLAEAKRMGNIDPDFLQSIEMLEQLLDLLMPITPMETALLANYPNPFNPETWIPYQLAKPAAVTLTIHAVDGKLVRALDLGHQRAGMYHTRSRAAYWDGKNAQGESVASGVYFYTLTAGEFTATRKLLIRK